MALSLMVNTGAYFWLLLAGLAVLLGGCAWLAGPWLAGLLYRGQHANRTGAGLDVLPWQPSPRESMQLDDDWPAWEARWQRQFTATHPAGQVQAAFDQRGGWVSGACDTPLPPGSGAASSWLPAPEVTSNVLRGGDGGGPAHMGAGPPPLALAVAHEEYQPPPEPEPEPIWPPVCSSEQWLRELQAKAAPGWTYAGGIAA